MFSQQSDRKLSNIERALRVLASLGPARGSNRAGSQTTREQTGGALEDCHQGVLSRKFVYFAPASIHVWDKEKMIGKCYNRPSSPTDRWRNCALHDYDTNIRFGTQDSVLRKIFGYTKDHVELTDSFNCMAQAVQKLKYLKELCDIIFSDM